MSGSVSRVQSANIDGRARSPRFIQDQLRNIHNVLTKHAQELLQAIGRDSGNTAAEAGIEYYLALACLKEQYASTSLPNALEEEYSVAYGKDATSRRVAAGIVYIVPSSHTPFFSIISALSTAIAAGNCVVLKLEPTISEVKSLLRTLLPPALDRDSFAIVESRPESAEFLDSCVQVYGNQSDKTVNLTQIVSPSSSRAVAIVDRSADISRAAAVLVRARFSFGGVSPYAPDLVLVNEFVIDEFSSAVFEQCAKYFSKKGASSDNGWIGENRRGGSKWLADDELREEGTSVIVSGANGSIVLAQKRTSKLLERKLSKPLLLMHAVRSLDDAIDTANRGDGPLLASYLFAAPTAVKYLSQFVDAQASFINQVPVALLVGPAAPLNHPITISNRYTKAMFEVPRPQFVQPDSQSEVLDKALARFDAAKPGDLHALAITPLPKSDQPPGHAIGFFEQGLLVGASTIMLPVVSGFIAVSFFGIRAGLRRYRA